MDEDTPPEGPVVVPLPRDGRVTAGAGKLTAERHTVDARSLDIVGVRLEDTGQKVIQTLEAKFRVREGKGLRVFRSQGVYVPGKPFIDGIAFDHPRFHLLVSFTEVFPTRPGQREAAIRIEYKPIWHTEADAAQFPPELEQKYGPPSIADRLGFWKWCVTVSEHLPGGFGPVCSVDHQAILQYHAPDQLLLWYPALEQQMREAYQRTVTQGRPPL